jgi:hypothetical protein
MGCEMKKNKQSKLKIFPLVSMGKYDTTLFEIKFNGYLDESLLVLIMIKNNEINILDSFPRELMDIEERMALNIASIIKK